MSRIDDDLQGPRVDWLAAMCRAAHTARWALCLVGLGLSIPVVSLALHLFSGAPEPVDAWVEYPAKMVQSVGQAWLDRGLGAALWRCLLLHV